MFAMGGKKKRGVSDYLKFPPGNKFLSGVMFVMGGERKRRKRGIKINVYSRK